jgi:pyrimidine-nucleoside phosphorylase
MIFLGGKAASVEAARQRASELLQSGAAWRKFERMCLSQGADLTQALPRTDCHLTVTADADGWMEYLDCEKIGLAGVQLGAGRRFQSDPLDLAAGIEVFRSHGDVVKKGDRLFILFASDESRLSAAAQLMRESYRISARAVSRPPLLAKVLT